MRNTEGVQSRRELFEVGRDREHLQRELPWPDLAASQSGQRVSL